MNTFSNIAFISYKREDEKWAVWLQKRLESYRLPSVIRSGQPGLPKYIRPVFRDKTDLGAGILGEELTRELESSKFLIVVCSPNSTKSEWINKEVSGFIEAGRSSFIIPFVVGGIPNSGNPESECFPRALQELPPESELLGINVNEIGREQAFVKVVARILDVKFDLLWDRHRRRLRARRSASWAIVSLLLLAGLFMYDYTRVKVEYFDGYIDCNGIPHGIFPVDDISRRNGTFKFEYRRTPFGEKGFYSWRLSKVRYVNSAGRTTDYSSERNVYPSIELLYTDGVLTEIINKDRYDNPVVRHVVTNDYQGNAACIVDFENAEKQEGSLYLNSMWRMKSDEKNLETKLKIKRFAYTRDSLGRIIKVTYHSNNSEDLEESAISDSDGIFGQRFVLDSLGRVLYEIYLNADGRLVPNSNGVAQKRYTYDSENNLVMEECLDASGNAVYNGRGVASTVMKYDSNGNRTEIRYLSPRGDLCYNADRIAVVRQKFDRNGNCTEVALFDTQGAPCNNAYNWHKMLQKFDRNGNLLEASFADANGNACITSDILSAVRYRYDRSNRPVMIETYGTDGLLCINSEGFARITAKYDSNGNVVETAYFDTRGQRCVSTKYGWSKCRTSFNSKGQMIGNYYYDAQDNPCFSNGKYASQLLKYDARGNVCEVANYDPSGNLCASEDIGAIMRWSYDDYGNVTSESYFDAHSAPMYVGGLCGYRFEYDKRGLMTARYCLDGSGSLVRCADNWAAISRYEYDRSGNMVKESYFDTDSMPCYNKNGIYSMAVAEYDSDNNLVKTSYFSADGRPMLISEGYSSATFEYDSKRKLTDVSYFDTDGRPCYSKNGYHQMKYKYDEKGNEIEYAYYDEYGRPYSKRGLEQKIVKSYDSFNREISLEFLDRNGRPVNGTEGYSRREYEYSMNGQLVEVAYYDAGGNLVSPSQNVACRTRYMYDERGNRIRSDYYDEQNRLSCKFGCATKINGYDEKNRIVKTVTYDELGALIGGYYGKPVEIFRYNDRNEMESINLYNSGSEEDLYVSMRFVYDRGKAVSVEYADSSGAPVVMLIKEIDAAHPFAKMEMEYNELGTLKRISYYDEKGELYDGEPGYSVMVRTDSIGGGRILTSSVYNSKGEAADNRVNNIHRAVAVYNEIGLISEQSYYDRNGNMAVTPWKWARKLWDYNAKGELQKEVQYVYSDGKFEVETYGGNTPVEDAVTADVPENKSVTLFLSVENYGQMYEAGFRNNYHILEWNEWNMYQGLDSFTEAFMKSRNREKRLLLLSEDTGQVTEYLFSSESLNARVMDYNDKSGDLFSRLSGIYEKWKSENR